MQEETQSVPRNKRFVFVKSFPNKVGKDSEYHEISEFQKQI